MNVSRAHLFCDLTIEALRTEVAAWQERWSSLRKTAEHDRDRAIPTTPAEARLQGKVERAAMIAVLDEMTKLEKVYPCVSTSSSVMQPKQEKR